MPKKCVSLCSGLDKDICSIKKECIFTNGSKMKYCRLNSNYTMDKDCNVTRKNDASATTKANASANLNKQPNTASLPKRVIS